MATLATAANNPTFSPLTGPVPTVLLADGAIRIERSEESLKLDELWHGVAVDPISAAEVTVYVRMGDARALMAELLFATIAHALHLPAARPFLVKVPASAVAGSSLHTAGVTVAFGCEDTRTRSFSVMLNESSEHKKLLRGWTQLGEVAAIDEWLINGDRNFGNLVYGNGVFTLIDHAEAFANRTAELWGLDDLVSSDCVANQLLQFAKDELPTARLVSMMGKMKDWLRDSAAKLDVQDCIERSQIEYVKPPHSAEELTRFIERRLTFTGQLLCNKLLGQANLPLQGTPEVG